MTMDALRIRIKLGENEFEGEGPIDLIRAELAAFKKLLPQEEKIITISRDFTVSNESTRKALRVNGRVVYLGVRTQSVENALLVLLLGQKLLRNNERVTGAEIMNGLRASGQRVNRVDHVLMRHVRDGSVVANGRRRSRRYKLTNRGIQKAQEITELLASAEKST